MNVAVHVPAGISEPTAKVPSSNEVGGEGTNGIHVPQRLELNPRSVGRMSTIACVPDGFSLAMISLNDPVNPDSRSQ